MTINRLGAAVALAFAAFIAGTLGTASAQFDTFGSFTRLLLGDGDCEYSTGSGSPEGVVTGDVCDIFNRTDGGAATTFYIKESGSGNTGWVAVAAAGVSGSGTAGTMTRWQTASIIEDASMTDADVVTGSTTDTFTNKTYDAEGTGNVLTIPEKWTFNAGNCEDSAGGANKTDVEWNTPNGGNAVPACVVGTNNTYLVLEYEDATTREAYQHRHLPADFTGTIDARILWRATPTTGSVVWQLATACVAVGEGGDPAFGTADTVTDAAGAVANDWNVATISPVTIVGCAADEELFLRMLRDPDDGSDDLGATADFIGLELTVRRAM